MCAVWYAVWYYAVCMCAVCAALPNTHVLRPLLLPLLPSSSDTWPPSSLDPAVSRRWGGRCRGARSRCVPSSMHCAQRTGKKPWRVPRGYRTARYEWHWRRAGTSMGLVKRVEGKGFVLLRSPSVFFLLLPPSSSFVLLLSPLFSFILLRAPSFSVFLRLSPSFSVFLRLSPPPSFSFGLLLYWVPLFQGSPW